MASSLNSLESFLRFLIIDLELSYFSFLQGLLGCSVAGYILDDSARSAGGSTNSGTFVKDKDGFSFTKMGYAVEFVKGTGNSNTIQVCRQVTKSLKECVEVEKSSLHTTESKQLKTDDEIISVGQ